MKDEMLVDVVHNGRIMFVLKINSLRANDLNLDLDLCCGNGGLQMQLCDLSAELISYLKW